MIWRINYRLKGDPTIRTLEVDLPITSKWDVMDWWKANHNDKKDKEIVNCSDGGTLKVKEKFTVQMVLKKGDTTVSSTITEEQIKAFRDANDSGFDVTYKILQDEYSYNEQNKK